MISKPAFEGTYNIDDGPRELKTYHKKTILFGLTESINITTDNKYFEGYHIKGVYHNPLFSFPCKEEKMEARLKYLDVPQNKIDYLLGRTSLW